MTDYPRPSLTADAVVLRWHGGYLQVLLIERGKDPFAGCWALPGGFVDPGEAPEAAGRRELLEETHLAVEPGIPVGTYGEEGRDPRGWVVSAAYLYLAPPDAFAKPGDDAAKIAWHPLGELPALAFDHGVIIADAKARLAELTQTSTAPLRLLGEGFRTKQARHLYAQILDRPIEPRAFKAWLRRRQAVERVGPARFKAADALLADWIR